MHNDLKIIIGESMANVRTRKHKTQSEMAREMRISRKTVSNWENGINAPGIDDVLKWFQILNENPTPYLIELLYPNIKDKHHFDIDKARNIICDAIRSYPEDMVMAIFYILFGNHGSSPVAFTQLCAADLQCSIGDRQTVSNIVINNYMRALHRGEITDPDGPTPNMEILMEADKDGREAYIAGQKGYFAKRQ